MSRKKSFTKFSFLFCICLVIKHLTTVVSSLKMLFCGSSCNIHLILKSFAGRICISVVHCTTLDPTVVNLDGSPSVKGLRPWSP